LFSFGSTCHRCVVLKRSILPAAVAVGLLASPAFAAAAPHGYGPHAQAAMIAQTAGSSKKPVQVLDQLCDNPNTQRGCTPIKANMRRALDRAVDAPIAWVAHERHHAGQFWVLGEVRFNGAKARTMVSWDDPGAFGCSGWTRLGWERHHGAWSVASGVSAEGCADGL
jgi:hypothetical protein